MTLLGNGFIPQLLNVNATYFIKDDFLIDYDPSEINTTYSEPEGGIRTVVDDNNKLSISSNVATFASGGVGAGNPGLYYRSINRVPGLIVKIKLTPLTANFQVGWETNTSASISHGWRFAGGNALLAFVDGSPLTVGTWAANLQDIAIVARATGCYFFLKPNGGKWALLWISTSGNQSPLFATAVAETSAGTATINQVYVQSAQWSPSPLGSDGFSVTEYTDGQGHAEGVANTVGFGGLGRLWTSNIGTWVVSSGVSSCSALAGGLGIRTINTGKTDVVVSAKVIRSGGNVGIILRYVDDSNYVYAIHNGTNVQLIKRIAGVETILINTAATYVASAEIRVISDRTSFRLFYNNVAIGTSKTINDVSITSGVKVGLYSSNTGNTLDDFTVYARGTSGEYSALDSEAPFTDSDYIFVVGDSKSTDEWNGSGNNWINKLTNELKARSGVAWTEVKPRFALSGYAVSGMKFYVDDNLQYVNGTPSKICVNIGTNDIGADTTPNETIWKANLVSIIDDLRAKWPNADIYVAKPWRQGSDSAALAVAGYINDVIATYPSHVFAGPNESVWVKGSDNGASMLLDTVHYNLTTAQIVAASEWLKAFGY